MHALSDQVLRVLAGENISQEELRHMLTASAICTKDGCNRRYHHWLFLVKDGVVERMQSYDPVVVGVDRGLGMEPEQCDQCTSAIGCTECGWRGEVLRFAWPRQNRGFR